MEEPIISLNSKRPPNRIPLFHPSPSIISQDAVNLLTSKVYYQDDSNAWLPSSFIVSSPTKIGSNYDVDVEHFCAPVVHPITSETITQYRKLVKDPVTNKYGQ